MTDGIVLVHGGMFTSAYWSRLIPLLQLQTITVDLPGRGDRPADLATVRLNDCVTAVLDGANHASFGKFALVGHSVGGVTITETAYQHPDRVSHLIYVAAFIPGPESTVARVHPLMGADVPDGVMEPPGEEITRSLFGNDLTEEQWVELSGGIVRDASGIFNATLGGYPTGIPISYISMEQDVAVPPWFADRMAVNLGPGVARHTINAGHSVMFSQPEALAAIINDTVAASSERTIEAI